ncbi:MAG: hypothetical protein IPJ88_00920 [Myxococcales bacterium]|nr:MAG: hypothetical protein IPJ88_00920 [Myxococcales bacterium]
MKHPVNKFYQYLDQPLILHARWILIVLSLLMLASFAFPLWKIRLEAPQYPDGLWMEIYAYTVKGGNDDQHISEINTLNHYIGMHPIDRTALSDLGWLPFAFGLLILWGLRVAVVGTVRSLLDLSAMTVYIGLFSFGRFVYKLYSFGHDLAPDAPVTVEPFTPAIIGSKQIANFTTYSYPELGSAFLGTFAVGVIILAILHLIVGRKDAIRADEV